jgi:hypothetical protein
MVKKIIVKKILSDEELNKIKGKPLPKGYFKTILRENCDVYTEEGDILLKLRKNVFSKKLIDEAYKNIIDFARSKTSTRGTVSGRKDDQSGELSVKTNKPIMSNIVGYFDTLSLGYKRSLKDKNMKFPAARHTAFLKNQPEKWKKFIPFVKAIDTQYKKLFPKHYKVQMSEANKTKYRIPGTSFTTVTTNLNLQTGAHTDKGDYSKGFGNLVVIEKGKYTGGFTGFPEYGVAVDLRSGDFLGMNVHKIHGNTPIEGKEGEYERLSFVSYLRENIVEKTRGLSLLPLDYFANPEKYQKGNYFEKKTRKTTKSKKVAKTKKQKTKKNKKANNSNNVGFNLL